MVLTDEAKRKKNGIAISKQVKQDQKSLEKLCKEYNLKAIRLPKGFLLMLLKGDMGGISLKLKEEIRLLFGERVLRIGVMPFQVSIMLDYRNGIIPHPWDGNKLCD